MNFSEILELHRAVSAFKFESSDDQPKLCVYETQNRQEGYILFIKPKSPNDAYNVFLEESQKNACSEFKKLAVS